MPRSWLRAFQHRRRDRSQCWRHKPRPIKSPAWPGRSLERVPSRTIAIDRSEAPRRRTPHRPQPLASGPDASWRWTPTKRSSSKRATPSTDLDGQLHRHDYGVSPPLGAIHPLTGPVYVKGADLATCWRSSSWISRPSRGPFRRSCPAWFLRDVFTTPFLVHWQIADGFATSAQMPNIRIPARRSWASRAWRRRRQVARLDEARSRRRQSGRLRAAAGRGGGGASRRRAARQGLPTLPPRENGGNFDVKQLTRGAKLFLPVNVEGALFSTGDAHFAQGDGEVCVTAVEMAATCGVRFAVHSGQAAKSNIRWPRFARTDDFSDPPGPCRGGSPRPWACRSTTTVPATPRT